jgi:hypothetical protein
MAGLFGLGAHASQLATAGLSLQHLGRADLFTVGLVLVGASVLLNIASLVIRRQMVGEMVRSAATKDQASERGQTG